jgi:hypothetical protein
VLQRGRARVSADGWRRVQKLRPVFMLQRGRARVSADGVLLLLLLAQMCNTSIATTCAALCVRMPVMLDRLAIIC